MGVVLRDNSELSHKYSVSWEQSWWWFLWFRVWLSAAVTNLSHHCSSVLKLSKMHERDHDLETSRWSHVKQNKTKNHLDGEKRWWHLIHSQRLLFTRCGPNQVLYRFGLLWQKALRFECYLSPIKGQASTQYMSEELATTKTEQYVSKYCN